MHVLLLLPDEGSDLFLTLSVDNPLSELKTQTNTLAFNLLHFNSFYLGHILKQELNMGDSKNAAIKLRIQMNYLKSGTDCK